MSGVLIIAEAGVNHNGKFETACKLVDEAKRIGADFIKFQTFKTELLVSDNAKKADYQEETTGSGKQKEMLKELELSFDNFVDLKSYCDKVGIQFLSTPFDIESIDFLNSLDIPFWKIPSGEITDYPYLLRIAKTKKPVVLSTGMCDIDEIKAAIDVLKENGTREIKILHCNTEYPTPYSDVNLKAMITIRDVFGYDVGYSDHTKGIEIPIAAVALGAKIIEKHFTLDNRMTGPDHRSSLEPREFEEMIFCIRNVEKAIGNGIKSPSESEKKNLCVARKSIVAKKPIKVGDEFSIENITTKRPGNGISPMRWNEIVGSRAKRDFEVDELIEI